MTALARIDAAVVATANRLNAHALPALPFAWASRLGNGGAWYLLMALLPAWAGLAGLHTALAMAGCGIVGTALYRWIKTGTRRPRPCEVQRTLVLTVAPLDRFSFPSGHTLHAVAFTVIVCQRHPELMPLLVPFTLLVAGSRMVLGLHYPSDVLAGAMLGGMLAATTLAALAGAGW